MISVLILSEEVADAVLHTAQAEQVKAQAFPVGVFEKFFKVAHNASHLLIDLYV